MKLYKLCPKCGKKITFKRKNAMVWSIKYNLKCLSCSVKSRPPASKLARSRISESLKNRKITWGNKISKALTGRKDTPEVRAKKSKAMTGKNNPFYGKKHNEETKKLLRLKFHKRMEEKYGKNGACPMYNPDACKIIDEYGKTHNYNFQHALNIGEFYIKELGYWVDGYDKDKNVVIEYYERAHKYKKNKEHDKKRKKQIIKYLKCKFIEIKDWVK